MATLVSVILPTYNRAYCLSQAVDSALNQSYSPLEVVILDDGSTDGTADVVRSRYGGDPRVIYHRRSNGGVSAARNAAMALARGEVLFFCDSDDIWHPDKVKWQMAAFAHYPHVDLVWTDVSAVDQDGRVLHERYSRVCYDAWWDAPIAEIFQESLQLSALLDEPVSDHAGAGVHVGHILRTMITGTVINMPAVAVRAGVIDRIGGFDESMMTGEDYDFNLRACAAGAVAFIDAPTVRYRIGAADQLTRPSLLADQARNWFRSIARITASDVAAEWMSPVRMRPILADKYAWLGTAESLCGNRPAARAAFWQSMRLGTRSPRVMLEFMMTLVPPGLDGRLRATYRSSKNTLRRG